MNDFDPPQSTEPTPPVTNEPPELINKWMTEQTEPTHCILIPELPYPWNGAYLEWCRELKDEPK